MKTNETPFRYTSLTQPRQIRLLGVSMNQDLVDCVQCEFHVVSLDYLPYQYNAISYMWRSPTKTDKVLCIGQYIDVAASAMSFLCKAASEPSTGYLWIDALCIDQSNNVERAAQVQLMRDVYTSAYKVIAWLQSETPNSEEAIDFMYTLHIANSKLVQEDKGINRHTLTQLDGCGCPSSHWTALSIFLENSWFQRAWIVQEMVVARQRDLICGKERFHGLGWPVCLLLSAVMACRHC